MEAERYKAFASLPLMLVFAAFGQYANYGARRYRLHKTMWRGLRFGMGGSGLVYMARALGWAVVIALTLGIALPWAQASLERYKMRNSSYGPLRGDFVGRGGEFFKRGWWIWAITLVVVATPIPLLKVATGKPYQFGLSLIAVFLAAPALYAAYKAQQWRWWLQGLRLGGIRLETRLTLRAFLINFYICFGIVMAPALVFGSAATFVAMTRTVPPQMALNVALIIYYVVTAVAVGIATRIYFVQRVWKIVANSLLVHGLETAENVAATGDASASAINEGFVDSLDVVGF
jgi:uncharacterized membrane protein YjgN (DUF898 family)